MRKPEISKKANKFRRNISPVREIMSYADPLYLKKIGLKPDELISYAGGWVNHYAPEELKESYIMIVNDNDLFHKSGGYSPTLGMSDTKKAIIKFEENLYNINNLDISNIAIGHSSTQLAYDILQVLLDPEDRILLLDPSYCNYPTQVASSFLDVNMLRFPVLNPNTWEFEADKKLKEFEEYILKHKPKLVLLVIPDNPTSKILSADFVKTALYAVTEIGSFLVIDFAYKEIIFYDNYPEYFSWAPSDNFISIHSNSKWGRGLGRRMGWVEAPDFVVESMESIMNSSILCPDTLHQMAFTDYINNNTDNGNLKQYIKSTRKQYQQAAIKTVESVEKYLNLPYLIPEGGLYTCVKVNVNSAKFVEEILKATGVLYVPGWGFGRTVAEGIRISFGPLVNDLAMLEEGIKRTGQYLKRVRS